MIAEKRYKITIAIPTYHRPKGILKALRSINNIRIPEDVSVDIMVIDNDANGSAEETVRTFAKESRFPVNYQIESRRGLSAVRNRILSETMDAGSDYLAGIDDDEFVPEQWLVHLWTGLKKYDADCAGASHQTILPQNTPNWTKYTSVFKTYGQDRQTGKIIPSISTGNYILNLDFVRQHSLRFSPRYDHIGGEDTDFFVRCTEKGAKIVWIKEAIVSELYPEDRLTIKWFIKRRYRTGYTRVAIYEKNGVVSFLKSLFKVLYLPVFSILSFLILNKEKGFKYFFRFFHYIGRLKACLGIPIYTKTINPVKFIRDYVRNVFFYPFMPYPKIRYIVVANERTGSTHLTSLLSSHPDIYQYGEVLGDYILGIKGRWRWIKAIGAERYLNNCFRKRFCRKAVGIKVLYGQFKDYYVELWGIKDLSKALDSLRNNQKIKVIHMKRKNKLKVLVSSRLAKKTKKYLNKDPNVQTPEFSILLTPEQCESYFKKLQTDENYFDTCFQEHDKIEIFYEDLVSDPQSTCSMLLQFLGVPEMELKSRMIKQSNKSLSEKIENYSELQNYFKGTPAETYFVD